jgi:hypothetical protein
VEAMRPGRPGPQYYVALGGQGALPVRVGSIEGLGLTAANDASTPAHTNEQECGESNSHK